MGKQNAKIPAICGNLLQADGPSGSWQSYTPSTPQKTFPAKQVHAQQSPPSHPHSCEGIHKYKRFAENRYPTLVPKPIEEVQSPPFREYSTLASLLVEALQAPLPSNPESSPQLGQPKTVSHRGLRQIECDFPTLDLMQWLLRERVRYTITFRISLYAI